MRGSCAIPRAPAGVTLAIPFIGVLSAVPLGCGGGDPVVSIVRIFQPRGDVVLTLDASQRGGLPDLVSVHWEGVPGTSVRGFVYQVWLLPRGGGKSFSLARLALPRDTGLAIGVQGTDLILLTSGVQVTLEPGSETPTERESPSQDFVTHLARAGPVTLDRIDELLGGGGATTPMRTGFAIRLVTQAQSLHRYAELARAQADSGQVTETRRHLERVLNIAEAPAADHNGDGTVEDPEADDLGVLLLAARVGEVARDALASSDAWEDAKLHGGLAALAADSTGSRVQRLQSIARAAMTVADLAALRASMLELTALSETIAGDAEAVVDATCSRCGALTAWRECLRMTTLRAVAQESFVLPNPAAGPGL